ncbi:MAG TPA: sugar ABC transporter permease [Spirochaetia bacterium]|nr:sugar ABC transporter permease [Spirochaetia bacterium]
MKLGKRHEGIEGFLLYTPSLVVIFFIVLYPIGFAVYLSTYYYHLIQLSQSRFVGLGNYVRILSDPEFWASIARGVLFTFGSLIPQIVLGLALAQLLNHPKLKAKTLWRGIVIMPWLVPTVTVAIVFRWMFNDIYGIINYGLVGLGVIKEPIPWLARQGLAMLILIIANVWRGLPLMVTMFLAGLQGIPGDLHEAARVDGATPIQGYLRITLPLLMPVVMIAGILRTIWIFNFYDLPWVMTQGGPAGTTETPPVYAYLRAFSGYRLGEGSTITVLLFLILVVFATIYFQLRKRLEIS